MQSVSWFLAKAQEQEHFLLCDWFMTRAAEQPAYFIPYVAILCLEKGIEWFLIVSDLIA